MCTAIFQKANKLPKGEQGRAERTAALLRVL
jgi:hypothetical protein